jgi:adenylate cyclase class 2
LDLPQLIPTMPRNETEIKLKVLNPTRLKGRLAGLGFVVVERRHLERNFLFDFPDLRLRKASSVVRLRFEGTRSVLTFKGAPRGSGAYKIRPEIETKVEDGRRLKEILEAIGLRQTFVYEKYRTTYHPGPEGNAYRGVVVYDETPIGSFFELEGPKRWIDKVARELGYARQDYITASYAALYARKCSEEGRPPENMVFPSQKN